MGDMMSSACTCVCDGLLRDEGTEHCSVLQAMAHALSSRSKDTLDMVMKLVDLCLSKLQAFGKRELTAHLVFST